MFQFRKQEKLFLFTTHSLYTLAPYIADYWFEKIIKTNPKRLGGAWCRQQRIKIKKSFETAYMDIKYRCNVNRTCFQLSVAWNRIEFCLQFVNFIFALFRDAPRSFRFRCPRINLKKNCWHGLGLTSPKYKNAEISMSNIPSFFG